MRLARRDLVYWVCELCGDLWELLRGDPPNRDAHAHVLCQQCAGYVSSTRRTRRTIDTPTQSGVL